MHSLQVFDIAVPLTLIIDAVLADDGLCDLSAPKEILRVVGLLLYQEKKFPEVPGARLDNTCCVLVACLLRACSCW